MQSLTPNEQNILLELERIAGPRGHVTGRELRDSGFGDFVARVYAVDVAYPQSLQSRKLQILRDKGYLRMESRNGGTYTILQRTGS